MGKYYGKVGFGITEKTAPGVWEVQIIEREVYGDFYKNTSRNEKGEGLNDNINVAIQVSFIADPYAFQNFHLIKYATYMGTKWKVATVTTEFPRLILSLGGVYNEE